MYLSIGCTSGIDLIFVLDSSGSIGSSNYITMKEFVTDVISNFEIGSEATHVGVIRFASSASIVIPLGFYNNNDSLINAVNSIPYTGGSTRTYRALSLLHSAFGTARVDQGIPRVAVITTDGRSSSFSLTSQEAKAVKDAGITAYSFGIGGGINMNELIAIAGNNTGNVFLIENFSASSFATQLQPLRTSTCTSK